MTNSSEEIIFNFFLSKQPDHDLIHQYGVVAHQLSGSDLEKYTYLKQQVGKDYKNQHFFKVPEQIVTVNVKSEDEIEELHGVVSISSVQQQLATGSTLVFEEAFQYYNAPQQPLYVCTILENGMPVGTKAIKQMKGGATATALLARGYSTDQIDLLTSKKYTIAKLKTLPDEKLAELTLSEQQINDLKKETRPPIETEIVHQLLFESKRTCCICRDPKKPIIIHHIIEWHKSRNNTEDNLVVLCLEHHDLAHTRKQLSLNLKPEEIKAHKKQWLSAVRRQDALAVLGRTENDYARWDYLNQKRVFELILDLKKQLAVHQGVFEQLREHNIINKMGFINDPDNWKCGKPSKFHFFDFAEGYLLAYHMKQLMANILEELELRDITNYFTKKVIRSSIKLGDYITLQKGFYFKPLNKNRKGRGQLRKAYYKKGGMRIEFVFDAYESTCSSGWGSHLTGHNIITPILRVMGIVENDDEIIINTSCLAIGSYFTRLDNNSFAPI